MLPTDAIGEASHANAPANAELFQRGKNVEQFDVNMPQIGSPQHGIWTSFLPLDESSSTESETHASGFSKIHDRGIQQHSNAAADIAAPSTWSQQATRGGGIRADSPSCASTSLLSITPYSKERRGSPCFEEKKGDVSEDEMLWKSYVFGSTDAAVCGSENSDAEDVGKKNRIARRARETAACNAVTSLSSSPFRRAYLDTPLA